MKLLGHVYVAITAFPHRNKELLAFGALLPETVFYTKPRVLTFEQIHEGGLELYQYCFLNAEGFEDIGIGSMTHSVKYGADSFNSLESLIPLGYVPEDLPKISQALGVDLHIAQARAHNLYDLVLDYYINKEYPEVSKIVESTKRLDMMEISKVLAGCYGVDAGVVLQSLQNLWEKYDLTLMESFEGLALFWRSLASDLKEKDPVDVEKTSILLSDFYNRMKPSADNFLNEVVSVTHKNVAFALLAK